MATASNPTVPCATVPLSDLVGVQKLRCDELAERIEGITQWQLIQAHVSDLAATTDHYGVRVHVRDGVTIESGCDPVHAILEFVRETVEDLTAFAQAIKDDLATHPECYEPLPAAPKPIRDFDDIERTPQEWLDKSKALIDRIDDAMPCGVEVYGAWPIRRAKDTEADQYGMQFNICGDCEIAADVRGDVFGGFMKGLGRQAAMRIAMGRQLARLAGRNGNGESVRS